MNKTEIFDTVFKLIVFCVIVIVIMGLCIGTRNVFKGLLLNIFILHFYLISYIGIKYSD